MKNSKTVIKGGKQSVNFDKNKIKTRDFAKTFDGDVSYIKSGDELETIKFLKDQEKHEEQMLFKR